MERCVYSGWVLVDGQWGVVILAIGLIWIGLEGCVYSFWLLVDGLCSVVFIAIGYWWTGCGA